MSTNAQVQVKARTHFSIDQCLGPGGGRALSSVLLKLSSGGYTAEVRERLPWSGVSGREHVYTRKLGTHEVLLELGGISPRITVSGLQRRSSQIEAATMRAAHTAVNQVLALAVSERVAERLSVYASERISARGRERVTESVALKALEMQHSRLAIRACCSILVNV